MQIRAMIQFVNSPKPGKQFGSVKTSDGNYISVHPSMLHQFQQGQTYDLEVEEREYQGKTYLNLKRVLGDQGNMRPVAAAAPRTPAPPKGESQVDWDRKNAAMFTMGVIGRALQTTGNIPGRDQVSTMVRNLFYGYLDGIRRTTDDRLSEPPPQSTMDYAEREMNDEIPF